MPKAPVTKDDLDAFLRDIDVRIQRMERHTHNFSPPAPPGPAPAPPYVPPPVSACDFLDEFDRANGPLGAPWIAGSDDTTGHLHSDQVIVDGVAIEPSGDGIGNMLMATGNTGYQSIEVTAANLWQEMSSLGFGGLVVETEWYLMCRASSTSPSCIVAYFFPFTGSLIPPATIPTTDRDNWTGEMSCSLWTVQPDGSTQGLMPGGGADLDGYVEFPAWRGNPAVKFRMEVGTDRVVRAYVDGVLLASGIVPAGEMPHGDHVGWGPVWYHTNYGGTNDDTGSAVQTLAVCINSAEAPCETFSDDFERADGPIGPNWELVTNRPPPRVSSPFTISGGALVGPGDPTPGYADAWMRPVVPLPGASQFVQCTVTGLLQGFSATSNIVLTLRCQANAATQASQALQFLGDDVGSQLGFYIITLGPVNTQIVHGPMLFVPVDPDAPATVRLEADADGHARAYLNGTKYWDIDTSLSATATTPVPVGARQTLYLYWEIGEAEWEFDVVSPRILSYSSGCLEP